MPSPLRDLAIAAGAASDFDCDTAVDPFGDDTRVDIACAADLTDAAIVEDRELHELRAGVTALRARLDERAHELHTAAERICELQHELSDALSRIDDLELDLAAARRDGDAQRRDIDAARTTIETLRAHTRSIVELHERELAETEQRAAAALSMLYLLFTRFSR
jgi:predicted  nucleic acid-binding Zn-ribbon protein